MEPLGRDTNAADEEETHSPAKTDSLAKEDMPLLRSEG